MQRVKGSYYGRFGGSFVPETLMAPLRELTRGFERFQKSKRARSELQELLEHYAGRPTPLYRARGLERVWKSGPVYLKREDLLHTGAHKINNCLGQALLARHLGKTRLIAETGAGQHGVATATVAALLNLECVVYMGRVDMERQAPNVARMKLLGASVVPVTSGSQTLKDATNEALRDWVTNVRDTHYLIGSVVGPHPFPLLVREFQSVIGREARRQIRDQAGKLPGAVIACVGGGSNALGIFSGFLKDAGVKLLGVEAGGIGSSPGKNAATLGQGKPGVLHGSFSYLLQDRRGQIIETHSVSAGLDYPGVGPEHSHLKESGRAAYHMVSDAEALAAFHELAAAEGILPALESSHALAFAKQYSRKTAAPILVNLSGRGDKDLATVLERGER